MKNILTISQLTVREALSRKIFITFTAISAFILILFGIFFASVSTEEMIDVINQNPESSTYLENLVKFFKVLIVLPLYGGGLFLSIFSSSSFIPHMLEQGSIELLLSKPVSRAQIILGKFTGGVVIVFLNLAFLIIGIWFLLGLKFGVWDANIMWTIFTITFAFGTLYAMMILLGIVTRSSLLAMMVSYMIFFILSPILEARENLYTFIESKFIQTILDVLYYIIPQTSDLGRITSDLAASGELFDSQPIFISIVFIILNLGLSIFIFSKKDY